MRNLPRQKEIWIHYPLHGRKSFMDRTNQKRYGAWGGLKQVQGMLKSVNGRGLPLSSATILKGDPGASCQVP